MKKTLGTMKESIEEEMNVSEIKKEALAYKQELIDAQLKLEKATDTSDLQSKITSIGDDIISDIESNPPKEEEITFKKKKKDTESIKEEKVNV
jgi:sec-independent protein translocase protein TatB